MNVIQINAYRFHIFQVFLAKSLLLQTIKDSSRKIFEIFPLAQPINLLEFFSFSFSREYEFCPFQLWMIRVCYFNNLHENVLAFLKISTNSFRADFFISLFDILSSFRSVISLSINFLKCLDTRVLTKDDNDNKAKIPTFHNHSRFGLFS